MSASAAIRIKWAKENLMKTNTKLLVEQAGELIEIGFKRQAAVRLVTRAAAHSIMKSLPCKKNNKGESIMKIQHQQLFLKRHVKKTAQPSPLTAPKVSSPKRLEVLIGRARKSPGKLQPQTLQALNQYLAKTGKPVITLPAPVSRWGTMPTISDIANNVQHAVSKAPSPSRAIPAPGRPMTTQEMQEHRLQQARELEQRRISEAKAAPKGAVVASWIGGGVVH